MNLPVPQLLKEIRQLHDESIAHAIASVERVIKCGKLLIALEAQSPNWKKLVEEIGISSTTAWRYQKVAKHAAKSPAKTKYLLEQGATLVDLYRAFGLVKPCVGGGYDPKDYEARRDSADAQLSFSFEDFVPQLQTLIRGKNIDDLGKTTLLRLRKDLSEAQARVESALTAQGTITLNPDHQP